LKKPKRRRTVPRLKQTRASGTVTASGTVPTENEVGDLLAGMVRARLALMPPPVAEAYRDLTLRDNLTIAEKAKVSVLEDTYSPSRQQIQAAVSEAHGETKRNRKAA
jgi:hypothetical protein